MKKSIHLANLFLVLLAILNFACQKDSDVQEPNKVEWVNVNQLKPGDIKHEQLKDIQIERIKKIHNVFSEVDGSSLDKWIDDFKRDTNPDSELAIWERMANAYSNYTKGKNLSLEAKKDAFQVILLRSSASEEEVLNHLDLKVLTKVDAKEIMKIYGNEKEMPISIK